MSGVLRTTASKLHAVRLVKSPIGQSKQLRAVLTGLNLKTLNHVEFHMNTPMVNGMLKKVIHLVDVQPVVFKPEVKTADGLPFVAEDGSVLGISEEDFLKSSAAL